MTDIETIQAKAKKWMSESFDKDIREEVKNMTENNPDLLIDAFYKDLEFGTGGLRGIMGAGTNRMNKYTVGMATQGLANFLLSNYKGKKLQAVIAYDSRKNSEYFAKVTASVFSANGIKTFLFDSLRPTPLLSFAIRELKCHTGIVITASHNPPEYNGYKVYLDDGGQISAPNDKLIIEEVKKISEVAQIKFDSDLKNMEYIGENIDKKYIRKVKTLLLNPFSLTQTDLKVVFTPLHGSTLKLLPETLKSAGIKNIDIVKEQAVPDGNFPTVKSPNPEEPSAFDMALELANKKNADIILGCDPDGDRLGVVIKNNDDKYFFLNGNQTAAIITDYVLSNMKKNKSLKNGDFIVKTIVTSEILDQIAEEYNIDCYSVLTGFKYIAELINKYYGSKRFIAGGEESYGFLVGDFVRDKDAVLTALLMCEIAAWAKTQNKTVFDLLIDIYVKYGYYLERLVSVTKKGKKGAEEIAQIMDKMRDQSPESINGVKVALVHDFLKSKTVDKISDLRYEISLPKSNVLQFDLTDGTKISVRPSGTEPKIKLYVSVNQKLNAKEDFDTLTQQLNQKTDELLEFLSEKYQF